MKIGILVATVALALSLPSVVDAANLRKLTDKHVGVPMSARLEAHTTNAAKMESHKATQAKMESHKSTQAKMESHKSTQAKMDAYKPTQIKMESHKTTQSKMESKSKQQNYNPIDNESSEVEIEPEPYIPEVETMEPAFSFPREKRFVAPPPFAIESPNDY